MSKRKWLRELWQNYEILVKKIGQIISLDNFAEIWEVNHD